MKKTLLLTLALSVIFSLSANAQAQAGIDQEICTNSTTLNGWVDLGCSSPLWTVLSGSATIDCPTCTTTTVTVGCGATVLKLTPQYIGYSCNFTPDEVTITRYCTPTPANAGTDHNQCGNSNFTLAGNTPSVGTGTWSVISGMANIANPASPNSAVSGITAGNSATLRWTITNGNNVCSANISTDDVVLTNYALPTTANAGADQSQCNNSNFTLAGNTPSIGTGNWSVISGTANIANPTLPNSSVTGVAAGTTAILRWTISNGTCSVSTDEVSLANNSIPSVTASANPDIICNGSSTTLTASGAATYNWSNGQSGSQLTVAPSTSETFTVTGTNSGCSNTAQVTVTVNSVPSVTASANSATICEGGSANLSATGATSYSWSPATGLNNANIANPVASPTTTATYTVTGTTNGCSDTAMVTVTVNPLPSVSISSNSPLCPGATLNLTANTVSGATYNWTGPNSFSSSLQNPSIANVSVADSGDYICTITLNGCTNAATLTASISTIPFASITPSGATVFCDGDSVILTATQGSDYLWNTSEVTQSVTIKISGNYSVTVTDPNGCTGTAVSQSLNVTVNPAPPVPEISQSGNTLACSESGMASYEWVVNGNILSDCTVQFCTCTQDGFYSVTIINASGCESSSGLFNVANCTTGIESESNEMSIKIFPNPTNGKFTLQFSNVQNAEVKIYNTLGEKIYFFKQKSEGAFSKEINLGNILPGIYFIQTSVGNEIHNAKLLIQP